jgi:hypothetical protein
MSAFLAIVALATAPSSPPVWAFRVETNLIKQQEVVAELKALAGSTPAPLRFTCSALDGARLTVAMGARGFSGQDTFTARAASGEPVRVTLSLAGTQSGQAPLTVEASADASDLLRRSYVLMAAEALRAAKLFEGNAVVTVTLNGEAREFQAVLPADGLTQALDACPFKI